MQDKPVEKKIIVVGKRNSMKKYIFLVIFLLLVLCVLLIYAWSANKKENEKVPLPSIVPTSTIKLSISPTVEVNGVTPTPTGTSNNGQKYIFPDCEIELLANTLWIPSSKGSLGTCGILSTVEIDQFTNITDFDGTLIAILPFLSDSPFAPEKVLSTEEYLEKIDKEAKRYSPTRDFLYSREDYQVDFRPAVITEIYKARLGMTKQIFYTGFRGEYIILWGGQTAESQEEEILKVVESIKYRQSLPGEEELL